MWYKKPATKHFSMRSEYFFSALCSFIQRFIIPVFCMQVFVFQWICTAQIYLTDVCLWWIPKGRINWHIQKSRQKIWQNSQAHTHTHAHKKTYRIYGYETSRVCSRRQQKSINQTRNDYCCEILQTNHTYCSRTHAHISKWLLTTRRWQWSPYNDYQNFQRHIVHPKRLLATPNQNKCLDPIVRKRARAAFASLLRTYASMKFIHLCLSICTLEQIHKIIFQHNHCH